MQWSFVHHVGRRSTGLLVNTRVKTAYIMSCFLVKRIIISNVFYPCIERHSQSKTAVWDRDHASSSLYWTITVSGCRGCPSLQRSLCPCLIYIHERLLERWAIDVMNPQLESSVALLADPTLLASFRPVGF